MNHRSSDHGNTHSYPYLSRGRKDVAAIKHGTKPTRQQRKLMEKWKVNTQDWLVERETNNELVLRHRHFDKIKIIPKGVREDG